MARKGCPLLCAVADQPDVVQTLLQLGADANARGSDGTARTGPLRGLGLRWSEMIDL